MTLSPRLIASVIDLQSKTSTLKASMLELTCYLGTRPEELRSIRPAHVEPGIAIRVTRAKRKEPIEERLPLPYCLFPHTAALVQSHQIAGNANGAAWLFPGKNPLHPTTTRTVTNTITKAFLAAGIAGVNPRALRHYAATRINQVSSLPTTQRLLGHASPRTTMLYLDSSFTALSAALTLAHMTDPTTDQLAEDESSEVVQNVLSDSEATMVPGTA